MSKILSKIGKKKKRIAGKKNRWKKKQNRLNFFSNGNCTNYAIYNGGTYLFIPTAMPSPTLPRCQSTILWICK